MGAGGPEEGRDGEASRQANWKGDVTVPFFSPSRFESDEPALEDAERVATLLDGKANLDPALGDNVDAICRLPRVSEAHLRVDACTSHAIC